MCLSSKTLISWDMAPPLRWPTMVLSRSWAMLPTRQETIHARSRTRPIPQALTLKQENKALDIVFSALHGSGKIRLPVAIKSVPADHRAIMRANSNTYRAVKFGSSSMRTPCNSESSQPPSLNLISSTNDLSAPQRCDIELMFHCTVAHVSLKLALLGHQQR